MKLQVSSYTNDALGHLDAYGILEGYANKSFTPLDVVKASIERAKQVNPHINAIAYADFERALNRVENAKEGVFSGIPTFIKDVSKTKGMPARHGSRAIHDRLRKSDDWMTKLMLELGVIVLGKSTTPENALLPVTETLLMGPTRNPWNLDFTPGGSSGGAAALVASGVVPIAHANDGGGSIRIPASNCGLIGFKPSRDRDLNSLTRKMLIDIVSDGIVCKSMRDVSLYFKGLQDYSFNKALPVIDTELKKPRPLKIAVFTDAPNGTESDADISEITLQTAKHCEKLGHKIHKIQNPFNPKTFEKDFQIYYSFLAYMSTKMGPAIYGTPFDSKQLEPFTLSAVNYFWKHKWGFSGAIFRLKKFKKFYQKLFSNYDVLLSPVLSTQTAKIGFLNAEVPFEDMITRLNNYVNFTVPQNIAGAPAVSIPMGFSKDGLPTGVQLAGNIGDESTLLQLAYQLESEGLFVS